MALAQVVKDLIYDVGMHHGDDTAFYLHQGFRVLAIEADPQLVEAAIRRFRSKLSSGRLTILNVGVAETAGTGTFWICEGIPRVELLSPKNIFQVRREASRNRDYDPTVQRHSGRVWCTILPKNRYRRQRLSLHSSPCW